MWKRITKYVIVISVILWLGYDIFVAFFTPETGDTISEVIRDWTGIDHLWIITYYMSILLGHFSINLWYRTPPFQLFRYTILIVLVILALVSNMTILPDIPWYMTIPGGLATGALLWGQARKK